MVSDRVARNLRELRKRRGLTTYQLADKLADLGHVIAQSGIVRTERGQRAVTVDDLVAFAVALDVSPNRLLLPSEVSVSRDDVQYGMYVVTERTRADTADMWAWATGEHPLVLRDEDWKPVPRIAPSGTQSALWQLENQPHHYPEVLASLARREPDGEG